MAKPRFRLFKVYFPEDGKIIWYVEQYHGWLLGWGCRQTYVDESAARAALARLVEHGGEPVRTIVEVI